MCSRLIVVWTILAFFVAGCGSPPRAVSPEVASTSGSTLIETGYIVAVRDVTVHDNRPASFSPVIGALLGGVAGSMIGSGTGQAIATTGGAIGGSIAAQEVSRSGSTQATKVTVRLDNGRETMYDAAPEDAFRIGERVQVITHHGKSKIVRIPVSPH